MFLNIPVEKLCVSDSATLHQAARVIEQGAKQIAMVVDSGKKLKGILTDGDLRRAIIDGMSMDAPVALVMQPSFISGTPEMGMNKVFAIMQEKSIRHVPIVDKKGVLTDLAWISDLIKQDASELSAVVMAGGFGKRLLPLTETLPKPMLPVGGRPVMEHIVDNLRLAGIRDLKVTTHYMPEKIKEHFGNGKKFGVKIDYVAEDRPLGTAGALALMPAPERPTLVVNGDIMTRVNYRAMLAFHREHQADLTVGVRQYEVQIPYGVMVCEGPNVRKLTEKPQHAFLVNAGIYLLSPHVYNYIPKNERYDMTDLIESLIADDKNVVSFPIMEYWLDIGQHADYEQANLDHEKRRLSA